MLAPENAQGVWIIKPAAAYCGKGINLFRSGQEIPDEVKAAKGVACRYIHPPYLLNGLKSDIRLYVLVSHPTHAALCAAQPGSARLGLSRLWTCAAGDQLAPLGRVPVR